MSSEKSVLPENVMSSKFDILPDDTIYIILSFLTPRDLLHVSLVNQKWTFSVLSNSDILWELKIDQKVRQFNVDLKLPEFASLLNFKESQQKEKYKKLLELCDPFYLIAKECFTGMGKRFDEVMKLRSFEGVEEEDRKQLKSVFVGSLGTGNTCLIITMVHKKFPEDYVPTVFDNSTLEVEGLLVNKKILTLGLWDTAGHHGYDELRPLTYYGTNVFIIGYSVERRAGFNEVQSRFIPEINKATKNVPIILVATKNDLRKTKNDGDDFVTTEEGRELAEMIDQIVFFVELSSMDPSKMIVNGDFAKLLCLAALMDVKSVNWGSGKRKNEKKNPKGKCCVS